MFGQAQFAVYSALAIAAFALEVYALVDAMRHHQQAYVFAGRQTKAVWLAMLGAAAAVGFLGLPFGFGAGVNALGILGLAAVVVAAVYLTRVRPSVRGYNPPRSSGGARGGW